MAENFPNMGRYLVIQVHEAHRSPNNNNLRRFSPRQTIIKLSKIKEMKRILKGSGERNL